VSLGKVIQLPWPSSFTLENILLTDTLATTIWSRFSVEQDVNHSIRPSPQPKVKALKKVSHPCPQCSSKNFIFNEKLTLQWNKGFKHTCLEKWEHHHQVNISSKRLRTHYRYSHTEYYVAWKAVFAQGDLLAALVQKELLRNTVRSQLPSWYSE
jgi:hypothetical protein